jgi:hypothetical protein
MWRSVLPETLKSNNVPLSTAKVATVTASLITINFKTEMPYYETGQCLWIKTNVDKHYGGEVSVADPNPHYISCGS